MTDFRALCAEIIEKVEFTWGSGIPEDVKELLNRARSALADEPASVVSEPSDEEIMELWHGSDWYNEGATLREFLSITRAVLARWGNSAPLPLAEGEVAELVEWLYEQLHVCLQAPWTPGIKHFGRAAYLLQRQYPQPVPVSERLPNL
jgi:hypothetical protein